jgi:hypothetical protein
LDVDHSRETPGGTADSTGHLQQQEQKQQGSVLLMLTSPKPLSKNIFEISGVYNFNVDSVGFASVSTSTSMHLIVTSERPLSSVKT